MKAAMQRVLVRGVFESLVVGAVLGAAGCASFQGNRLSAVASFPQVQTKKTADLHFAFSASTNGSPVTIGVEATRCKLASRCVARLKESGLFGNVSENLANPDLRVDVRVEDVGEGSVALAFLTGLTLYVIPSRARETYRLSATVTDMKSSRKADIKLEDHFTQWQQILLLPLLPLKPTVAEAAKCQNKLFDNLAIEIHRTGMLE